MQAIVHAKVVEFLATVLGGNHVSGYPLSKLKSCCLKNLMIGGSMQSICAALCPTTAMIWSTAVAAQAGFDDPAGSGPIISAVRWLEGTLLGTVATAVAVIAVACVGMLMLTGRINWRYGVTVIVGCFILFGAASIVGGIQTAASAGQYQ